VLQGLPECPAAAAVVGAVAAQEVIKAVTHMYTPISQFLMFEGIGISNENEFSQANAAGGKSPAGGHVREEELKGSGTKGPLRRRLLRKAKDLLYLSDASTSDLSKPDLPATSLTTDPGIDTSVAASDANTNVLAQLYGAEVIEELQSLRVFVVGAGAIGSEILKNLALLGVGSGASQYSDMTPVLTQDRGGAGFTSSVKGKGGMKNSTVSALKVPRTRGRKSMWEKQGLQQGGIVVTDMDKIERSNLNRQLLFRLVLTYVVLNSISHIEPLYFCYIFHVFMFLILHREQQIGQYKSLTAAAQVAHLNPALLKRVHGLTLKVGAETEQTFNGAFWAQTDVVITALVRNIFLHFLFYSSGARALLLFEASSIK